MGLGESSLSMTQYTILLFGPASSKIGSDRVVIEVDGTCTNDQLKAAIGKAYPTIEGLVQVGRLAVNQGFAAGDVVIEPDAEIALITMVSGG